jgi:hypothetical protein
MSGWATVRRISDMPPLQLPRVLVIAMFITGASCQFREGEQNESLLRMKAQCQQAGVQARARWVKRYPAETFSNEPEYGYSSQLHTCLYADSYSDSGGPLFPGVPREDRFVEDVYANKVILELTLHAGVPITTDGDPTLCKSEKEFVARKAQLLTR